MVAWGKTPEKLISNNPLNGPMIPLPKQAALHIQDEHVGIRTQKCRVHELTPGNAAGYSATICSTMRLPHSGSCISSSAFCLLRPNSGLISPRSNSDWLHEISSPSPFNSRDHFSFFVFLFLFLSILLLPFYCLFSFGALP